MVRSGSLTDVIVPLVSRRRERLQLMQKVQHGLPAALLFTEGLERIVDGVADFNRWLGTAETFAAILVLGGIARSIGRLRFGAGHTQPRRHIHRNHVDWLDIGIALMLFVEVGVHYAETQHWRRPALLTGFILLALGLLHGRLTNAMTRVRALRITDAGVSAGGRFLARFTAAWPEIERIDIGDKDATIVLRDGRTKRFDLVDLRHSGDIARALGRAKVRLEAAARAS